LRYPAAQVTKLRNKPGIVIQKPANSINTSSTWCVQLSGFDEAGFEVESAAHNQRYIKSRRDR